MKMIYIKCNSKVLFTTSFIVLNIIVILMTFNQKSILISEDKYEKLSKIDSEIIHDIIEFPYSISTDKTYFITCTPLSEWSKKKWKTIPENTHEKLTKNSYLYLPAHDAEFVNGQVVQRSNGKVGWMRWITIRNHISDKKVVVEQGIYSGQLTGGANIEVWEKIKGCWKMTTTLQNFVY